MPNKIKYLLALFFAMVTVNFAVAQQDNIYLDGENYITLSGTIFPSKLEWADASAELKYVAYANQIHAKTYWFSHNGNSYIIIVLSTGRSMMYIELGDNRSSYQLPNDYDNVHNSGSNNDFELYVENKSGAVQECDVTKSDKLSVKVIRIDSLHVQLTFKGTITPLANNNKTDLERGDPYTPITISGKVSLSKRSPGLAHLPDSYPGCDNTIYNEMSPLKNIGQFYTPTECEQSFYKETFATLSKALSPVIKYLATQDWDMSSVPKCKPLMHRLHTSIDQFFQKDPGFSGIDYDLDMSANPMKGAYHDYMQKIMKLAQESGQGDPAKGKELENLQKEEPSKFKLHLQAFYNQPVQTNNTLDLSRAVVKKINDNVFLIEHVANTSNRDFHSDGGAYLFIGKWSAPQFKDGYITCSPVFHPNAKKLSIQAAYIRIGCGDELANKIISLINMNSLQELLKVAP